MSNNNRVSVNIKNKIAYVKLNRADKKNAIDMAMFTAIKNTIKSLKKNRSIRAIILSGDGNDFCSGLDVSLFKSGSSAAKLLFKWHPWQANLAQFISTGWAQVPVPVIAAIHGRCWGGGLQIAFGADFRISTPDASIAILESKWGLIPDMGGTVAFKKHMTLDVTKELAMTGKELNGIEANKLGMITYVSEDPIERAEELAAEIIKQNPDAVAACKKLYNRSWHGSDGLALLREAYYQIRTFMGKNQRIKAYNQTHEIDQHREFKNRKNW